MWWWFSGSSLRDGSVMRCGYTVGVALLPAAPPLCVSFFSFFGLELCSSARDNVLSQQVSHVRKVLRKSCQLQTIE